jgi:hypothetical protein
LILFYEIFGLILEQKKGKRKQLICNGLAGFLIFTGQAVQQRIEALALYEGETIWLTQKLIAVLFKVSIPTINPIVARTFKIYSISVFLSPQNIDDQPQAHDG